MAAERAPFRETRVVRWGDCDPAGIIYTPRVFDYAMEALEGFYREVLGVSWMALNFERDSGAPTVRIECDFVRAPRAGERLEVSVRIQRIGKSSVTYLIEGIDEGGHLFRVSLVACFIARPAFESAPIPDDIRARMVEYQAECGDA